MTQTAHQMPLLKAQHLVKTFGHGSTAVHAVNDVSLEVFPGELVVIKGPSGSGKTTLISILAALLRPDSGTVHIQDTDITQLSENALAALRARTIGFIFQSFNLLEALSVDENILFPARLHPQGLTAARPRAQALIKRLKLERRRHAKPNTLSGGEKQRVAIARALINQPKIVFADEPTGNLDSASGQDVLMILHDIARDDNCAIVLVTHDPRVEDIADRILWLEDGALRDRKAEPHAWVRDPVCGMRVDEWTATMFTEHDGQRYVFCSQRCQQRFEEAPETYLDDAV